MKHGRKVLDGTFEVVKDDQGTSLKVFHSAFLPLENSEEVLILNFAELSNKLDLP